MHIRNKKRKFLGFLILNTVSNYSVCKTRQKLFRLSQLATKPTFYTTDEKQWDNFECINIFITVLLHYIKGKANQVKHYLVNPKAQFYSLMLAVHGIRRIRMLLWLNINIVSWFLVIILLIKPYLP